MHRFQIWKILKNQTSFTTKLEDFFFFDRSSPTGSPGSEVGWMSKNVTRWIESLQRIEHTMKKWETTIS